MSRLKPQQYPCINIPKIHEDRMSDMGTRDTYSKIFHYSQPSGLYLPLPPPLLLVCEELAASAPATNIYERREKPFLFNPVSFFSNPSSEGHFRAAAFGPPRGSTLYQPYHQLD